jgi:hypothetical protein
VKLRAAIAGLALAAIVGGDASPATLRIVCTLPTYGTARCDSPTFTPDTAAVSVYWHVFGPVTFSAYDPPGRPGSQLVRTWTLPAGRYSVHAQTRNRAGFGCDTVAAFTITEPPAAASFH